MWVPDQYWSCWYTNTGGVYRSGRVQFCTSIFSARVWFGLALSNSGRFASDPLGFTRLGAAQPSVAQARFGADQYWVLFWVGSVVGVGRVWLRPTSFGSVRPSSATSWIPLGWTGKLAHPVTAPIVINRKLIWRITEFMISNLSINRLLVTSGSWLMVQGSWLMAKKKGRNGTRTWERAAPWRAPEP